MTADNVNTLFDFEKHIEAGVESILESQLVINGVSIAKTRGTGDLLTPRIDVMLIMGPATEHRFPYKGDLIQNAYQAKLQTTIVTERLQNNDSHGNIRAQLRLFMQTKLVRFTGIAGKHLTHSVLPYHALARITELSTKTRADDSENLDYSDLLFDLVVSIRDDAWPA